MPCAVSCSFVPVPSDAEGAVTLIEFNTGAVTETAAAPETAPHVALMVAEPVDNALTSPPALTLAIVLAFEFQLTWLDTSWVVPSLNEACAVSCCV